MVAALAPLHLGHGFPSDRCQHDPTLQGAVRVTLLGTTAGTMHAARWQADVSGRLVTPARPSSERFSIVDRLAGTPPRAGGPRPARPDADGAQSATFSRASVSRRMELSGSRTRASRHSVRASSARPIAHSTSPR